MVVTIVLIPLKAKSRIPVPCSWHIQTHFPHRTHLFRSYMIKGWLESMGNRWGIFLSLLGFNLRPRRLAIRCNSQFLFLAQFLQSRWWWLMSNSNAVLRNLCTFGVFRRTLMPSLAISVQEVAGLGLPSISTKHKRQDASCGFTSRMAHKFGI